MGFEAIAQFLARHALLFLALAVALLSLALVVVAALGRAAARYKNALWAAIDLIVPGPLWRPQVYLVVHLALGLVVTAALGALIVIAEEIVAGRQLAAFDVALAEALRAETSTTWRSVFWYVTWLGSAYVVAPAAIAVAWMLAKSGRTLLAVMWSVAVGGSALINYAMKVTFARARPEGADPALYDSGWSFPRGHAMNTFVLCGAVAYIVWRLSSSWTRASLVTAGLFAFTIVIGFSRMYLGVHYASDVVAGYLAGTAWMAVCVSGAEVALRRRSGRSAS